MARVPDAPRIVLITDRHLRPLHEIWSWLPAAASAGLTGLMVREKDLPGGSLLQIASDAVRICRPLEVEVIVNDRIDVALACGADAVHLGVASLPVAEGRRIARGRLRVGASTHTIAELHAAEAQGADYVTFGPVFETASKAAYGPPVGVDALARACEAVALPVLALGGITLERTARLRGAGIAGVAAISGIIAAPDPAAAVRGMASALAGRDAG